MRRGVLVSRISLQMNPTNASAGLSCKESRNRMNAPNSASVVLQNIPWGQLWYPPRAPARLTISIEEKKPDTDLSQGAQIEN